MPLPAVPIWSTALDHGASLLYALRLTPQPPHCFQADGNIAGMTIDWEQVATQYMVSSSARYRRCLYVSFIYTAHCFHRLETSPVPSHHRRPRSRRRIYLCRPLFPVVDKSSTRQSSPSNNVIIRAAQASTLHCRPQIHDVA
jgi:hypothetical protein